MQLSEKENEGTEHTAESRMLAASREEIRKEVKDDVTGWRRVRDKVLVYVDVYIWEPLCTGMRFLHLVVIFVPVIVSVPMLWVRKGGKEGQGKWGAVWWFKFLVRGMERAGPAFIKVCIVYAWWGRDRRAGTEDEG